MLEGTIGGRRKSQQSHTAVVPRKESGARCVARRLDTRQLDPITATKSVSVRGRGTPPDWSSSP